jgi:hypothetical protein
MARLHTHLTTLFTEFADTTQSRAPLYSAMSTICATAPWCHSLMALAPELQRLPMLWFASLHRICIDHRADPLAQYFPSVMIEPSLARPATELSASELEQFCERHKDQLAVLLSTRRTQTNEVGRCALLLPILAGIENRTGQALRLLDVGTSAGLTLGLDRYNYRYEPGGEILSDIPGAPTLVCGISGSMPVPDQMPHIVARRGVDTNPLDLANPEDALWLQACVWADQVDRSRILSAAIEVAKDHPEDIHRGDAVRDLRQHLDQMAGEGHVTLITTWVLNYLSAQQRAEFIDVVDTFGQQTDLTWLGAEQPDQISPITVRSNSASRHLTHLVTREWRSGSVTQTTWATAHPHGYWMHWNPL